MNLLSRLCLAVCAFGLALEAGAKSAAEVFEEVSDSVVVVYGKDHQGDVISLASESMGSVSLILDRHRGPPLHYWRHPCHTTRHAGFHLVPDAT